LGRQRIYKCINLIGKPNGRRMLGRQVWRTWTGLNWLRIGAGSPMVPNKVRHLFKS
jgi:hypothetical protein